MSDGLIKLGAAVGSALGGLTAEVRHRLIAPGAAVASALARAGRRFDEIPGRLAAVGEGTARALESFGVQPDLVPSTFTTSALGRAMPRGAAVSDSRPATSPPF